MLSHAYDTGHQYQMIPMGQAPLEAWVAGAASPHAPIVVVLHDHFGLAVDVRRYTSRLSDAGYFAVAPNLHRGQPRQSWLSERDPEHFDQALELLRTTDLPGVLSDVEEVLSWARQTSSPRVPVAVVGFGTGGLVASLLAAHGLVDAAVAHYPIRLGRHLTDVARSAAPILVHFAVRDSFTPPAEQRRIRDVCRNNRRVQFVSYPLEQHRFAAESSPSFERSQARVAEQASLAFLTEVLAPSLPIGTAVVAN